MKTKIVGADQIDLAASLIKNDDIVAFPTETVYGLGGNAFCDLAIDKIYKAKGRPTDNPLIVHIDSVKMLPLVAIDIPDIAYELFEKFSPGPLTIILKKHPSIASKVSRLSTVGVRIPNHPLALKLIKHSGVPIAAPSANLSTNVSPTLASHVYDDFNGKIPLIIDGGASMVGIESTIIDLTKSIPTILRPGSIKADELLPILKKVKFKDDLVLVAEAPGMMYKHYAPKVDAYLANKIEDAYAFYNQHIKLNPLIIGLKQTIEKNYQFISLGHNILEAQKNYYQVLRAAEKTYGLIIIVKVSDDPSSGLMNRILKSCSNKIILT